MLKNSVHKTLAKRRWKYWRNQINRIIDVPVNVCRLLYTHCTFNIGGDGVVAGNGWMRLVGKAPSHIILWVDTQSPITELFLVFTVEPVGRERGEREEQREGQREDTGEGEER